MIQQIAKKTAVGFSELNIIESKDICVYTYGLELLISSFSGVLALIVISAFYGKPLLWIPYLAGFIPLRLSGGGYHAKTHFRCVFIFSLIYAFILLIEWTVIFPIKTQLIACIATLAIIFLFSPVQAPNKPLKYSQCKSNRQTSIILGTGNLIGSIVILLLVVPESQWVTMYFAGSSMAGLSLLLAVIKRHERRM